MKRIEKMAEEEILSAVEIRRNIQRVRENIRAACLRAGRNPEEVQLIAVSKKKPFSCIAHAAEAGVHSFGENYVQELLEKMEEREGWDPSHSVPLAWHMIGHLQKNKIKYLIGQVSMIHSVDTLSLAEQIEKEAGKKEACVDILMEVNVAREENKWGFDSREVLESARAISGMPHLRLRGLMTSAPYTTQPESNRLYFRELRQLAEKLTAEGLLAPGEAGRRQPVLSMGMSGDYEVAVEEGTTMIRVGSSIFGARS